MITLKRPTKEYESEALAFKQEFIDEGEMTINGSELLDQMDSYDEWLKSITDNVSPETVNPSWVVTDTYFAFDENGSIVGIIDLRHELNDFLKSVKTIIKMSHFSFLWCIYKCKDINPKMTIDNKVNTIHYYQ